ncbi:MAG: 2-C-methyl-D-erythritol 4-phosphate cytidylyltransferase [Herbaspirillum sp.]|jgi:2-C-methyl-D-erythritol 4-phosphate cytidylyltransferase|nr:2-C-methyl-D-erythritol 4-phosphate cytidylyltransferase [Herbaspirillum sp.]
MNPPRRFALIPAAGIGARVGAACPKQYLPLAGKAMLRHSLDIFAASELIDRTFVVVGADDPYIGPLMAAAPHLNTRVIVVAVGAATRQESVRNGLRAMRAYLDEDDWVLVHDAARPGLDADLLTQLTQALHGDPVGGLLALPVVDTVKRSAGGRAHETVPRTDLWTAQTPQMFRYQLLVNALDQAPLQAITDDASAIEMLGLHPKLVPGSPRNFKITLPQDMLLAEHLLKETSP